MKLILCRNNSIGSWFLRFVMWSRWSHSAVMDEEQGLVYDTTLWQGGCKVHSVEDFGKKYPVSEVRDIKVGNVDAARAWLQAQLGKPYDWTALVGFAFRSDWQRDDKWFCSEHSETFRALFGRPVFRGHASRITPHHQDIVI